jgi:hypothetical protein
MKESKNMLNSILFYAEKEYKINDYWQRRLFRVNVSTLMQLGYDIGKHGYSENDIVYLNEESYKNFMASQAYYESKESNVINNNEDISNVRSHR